MPNKYLNELEYATPVSTYAGEAVPEVKALSSEMSNQYEETRKNKDILDMAAENLDVRDVDFPVKKKAIEDLRNQFSQLVQNGDYQNANYAVKDVAKKFATDKMIQGALKSKGNQTAYEKDLQDRLEKGKIKEEVYLYKLGQSKQKNKEALTYDPSTGLYKNMYKGVDAYDDKSKEIYDEMYKRSNGWKATDMTINGKHWHKIEGVSGGYINMETGEKVDKNKIQNQLITELSNRGDFADFMNQEKEIDTYKLTGGTNIINKDVLKKVISEDKLNLTIAGVTQEELDALQKSKKPEDKVKLQEKLNLIEEAKTKELSKEEAEKIYNTKYRLNQLDKYTEPAAEKESYEKFKDTQWKNETYLMSLEHKYRKAEKELENAGITIAKSNQSVMQNFSPQELQNNYTLLNKSNADLESLNKKYGGNLKNMSPEDRNIYEKALTNKKIVEGSLNQIKEDMKAKGVDLNEIVFKNAYIGGIEDQKSFNKLVKPLLESVLKTPGLDEETRKLITQYKDHSKPSYNSQDGAELFNILNKREDTKKLMSIFSDKIIEVARKEGTPLTGMERLKKFGLNPMGVEGFLQNVKIGLDEGDKKYFENKDIIRTGGQVLSITDKDPNKIIANEARQWTDLTKINSDLKLSDGSTVKEYVDKVNEGKEAKDRIEVKDVKVQPIYTKINGKYKFQVVLPNNQTELVTPENQKEAQESLKRIATEYIKSSDVPTRNKGYEMLGQVYNDFSTINLNDFKSSEAIPVELTNGNGSTDIYKLEKIGEDNNGNPSFALKTQDGAEISLQNGNNIVPFDSAVKMMGKSNGNTFGSLNELATYLYTSGFNGR